MDNGQTFDKDVDLKIDKDTDIGQRIDKDTDFGLRIDKDTFLRIDRY